MQTGLAVGDTQAEREKAEFTQLKFWVSNACYDTFNTFSSILMILAKVSTCIRSLAIEPVRKACR